MFPPHLWHHNGLISVSVKVTKRSSGSVYCKRTLAKCIWHHMGAFDSLECANLNFPYRHEPFSDWWRREAGASRGSNYKHQSMWILADEVSSRSSQRSSHRPLWLPCVPCGIPRMRLPPRVTATADTSLSASSSSFLPLSSLFPHFNMRDHTREVGGQTIWDYIRWKNERERNGLNNSKKRKLAEFLLWKVEVFDLLGTIMESWNKLFFSPCREWNRRLKKSWTMSASHNEAEKLRDTSTFSSTNILNIQNQPESYSSSHIGVIFNEVKHSEVSVCLENKTFISEKTPTHVHPARTPSWSTFFFCMRVL